MNRPKQLLAALVLVALPSLPPALADGWYGAADFPLQPLRTSSCLIEGTFSCAEYVYTYSVRGVSCTEDCLIISALNNCQLTNRCNWQPASGCFLKEVCLDVSELLTCRRWETVPICGR